MDLSLVGQARFINGLGFRVFGVQCWVNRGSLRVSVLTARTIHASFQVGALGFGGLGSLLQGLKSQSGVLYIYICFHVCIYIYIYIYISGI